MLNMQTGAIEAFNAEIESAISLGKEALVDGCFDSDPLSVEVLN